VRFLRARGCIAYQVERSSAIEALRPLALAAQERAELIDLLATWLADQLDMLDRAVRLRGSDE